MFTYNNYKISFSRCVINKDSPKKARIVTTCQLKTLTGEVRFTAKAVHNPVDKFNKDAGRRIALSRCISTLDRKERIAIFKAYGEALKKLSSK